MAPLAPPWIRYWIILATTRYVVRMARRASVKTRDVTMFRIVRMDTTRLYAGPVKVCKQKIQH